MLASRSKASERENVARGTATRTAFLAALVLLLASCDAFEGPGTPPPLSPVPGPSDIQVVGTIVSETARDLTREFRLSDGRVIAVDFSTKRRVGPAAGPPAILVLGRDDRGDWAAVVGHQDGTPDGCHVLNEIGYELGDSIAIAGVRWRKGSGFHTPVPVPPLVQFYAQGSRFCLNDKAQVTEVIAP